MSLTYPGGFITKSPTAPTTNAAPGIWTMDQALQYIKAGTWPLSSVPDPYFNYTTLLLSGDGTNGAHNESFDDESTNNFSITPNGNVTQGTFSPFSQTGWSNYFDGSGDYLTTSSSQVIPSGNFTIEAFVYVTDSDATQTIVSQGTSVGDSARTWIGIESSSGAKWAVQVGGTQAISSVTPTLNTWHYVAMVYNGSTIKMYLNGSEIASASNSTNASNTTMKIGSNWGSYDFFGYISNVRISNTARTIGSTPTSAFTADANTVFLGCRSNRFVDISTNAYALTATDTPSVQAFSPFAPTATYSAATNGGGGYFDGSGDYLSFTTNSNFVASGDFTIDFWAYFTSTATYQPIFDQYNVAGFLFRVSPGSTVNGDFYINSTSGSDGIGSFSGTSCPINAWNFFRIVRSGSTVTVYCNGVSIGSRTRTGNVFANSSTFGIANYSSSYFSGYLTGIRIISSALTGTEIPTAPPTTGNLILNFTNAGIIDSTGKNVLETVGDAQIDTGTKKFGTGSMKFDGTGDYLVATSRATTSLEGDFTIEWWNYRGSTGNNFMFTVGDSSTSTGIEVYIGSSGGQLNVYSNNGVAINAGTPPTYNTWSYYALVRSSGVVKLYVNGTQAGSSWSSTATFSGNVYVGAEFYGGSITGSANGYFDDFRITKGVARTITTPTKAFPLF
jgi:hypothetical protein